MLLGWYGGEVGEVREATRVSSTINFVMVKPY